MSKRGYRIAIGVAIGLGLVGSCSTEPCACPPVLVGIVLVSGNHQVGAAGQVLAAPIVVRAIGVVPSISKIPGTEVYFEPEPGSGSVSPSTATADADGIAQVLWTLGPEPGEDTLIVRVSGPEDHPQTHALVTATVQ